MLTPIVLGNARELVFNSLRTDQRKLACVEARQGFGKGVEFDPVDVSPHQRAY